MPDPKAPEVNEDGTPKASAAEPKAPTAEDFTKLLESNKNLEQVLGRQGKELGDLKSQLSDKDAALAQKETDAQAAAAKAAKDGKIQEIDTALTDANTEMAGIQEKIGALDPTDSDHSRNLAKLLTDQTKAQNKIIGLSNEKAREEALTMAEATFTKTLGERDAATDEREAQTLIDQFHEEEPGYQEMLESGEIAKVEEASRGFHDPVSAYLKIQRDTLSTENADLKKRLALALGEEESGDVITSTTHVSPATTKTEKLGAKRHDSKAMDAGMMAALKNAQGAG